MEPERLDLVVMGATGFTGSHTVRTIMDLAKEKGGFSWGVSGRNPEKLQNLLKDISSKGGQDVTNVPMLIADINDEKSLIEVTKRARVILNCCGPYRFYGEKVVKACIETKTHHVDVSGEPQFMEETQLYYNDAASANGVYLVSACGLSGIPADVGVSHFAKMFEGVVNDVELFVNLEINGNGKMGKPVHYATYESAIHGLAHMNDLKLIRKRLFSIAFPKLKPTLKSRGLLHKSSELGGKWCMRFSAADRSVVRRSQHYLYTHQGQRPIQCEAYITVGNLLFTLLAMFVLMVTGGLAVFGNDFVRKILLKYPSFFSLGVVGHDGPTEEEMNNLTFHMTFSGRGWNEKVVDKDHSAPPNKEMKMRLSAKNPGYGFTCTALVLAATTIIAEKEAMPDSGGVFSPGVAFANTSLVKQLQEHGLKIEVIEKKEIK